MCILCKFCLKFNFNNFNYRLILLLRLIFVVIVRIFLDLFIYFGFVRYCLYIILNDVISFLIFKILFFCKFFGRRDVIWNRDKLFNLKIF